jgi:uncharacterized protein DUF4446
MNDLGTTQGIVALAAAGVGVVALLLVAVLWVKLRRLRSSQQVVLGGHGDRDLIAHAERLEGGFVDLRDWVEEVLNKLGDRVGTAEQRIDGALAHTALVRYDAYGEMSGRQSSSFALLDAHRSGIVVSSILHREQARVYVKRVHNGQSELDLSPEELEAIEAAFSPPPARAEA